jgi:membrane dipeptidase
MPLLWDQHTCLPLHTDAEVEPLTRYRRGGGAFLSVNAGYADHTFNDTVALLRHYRAAVNAHPDLELAANFTDVEAISRAGRIAVAFDLEDSAPLDGDLNNLATLMGLGVRTLLPTYNHANRAGSGCLDVADGGLTAWGRSLVSEMNRVGVVPDGIPLQRPHRARHVRCLNGPSHLQPLLHARGLGSPAQHHR